MVVPRGKQVRTGREWRKSTHSLVPTYWVLCASLAGLGSAVREAGLCSSVIIVQWESGTQRQGEPETLKVAKRGQGDFLVWHLHCPLLGSWELARLSLERLRIPGRSNTKAQTWKSEMCTGEVETIQFSPLGNQRITEQSLVTRAADTQLCSPAEWSPNGSLLPSSANLSKVDTTRWEIWWHGEKSVSPS